MNIYIGNLSYQATDDDLKQAFESYGEVSSVTIIKDRVTNQSKGFGFVEMPKQADAETAIKNLNGINLKGRKITVNIARPRDESRSRQKRF